MHCPNCTEPNPDRAKFCMECGTPLPNPAEDRTEALDLFAPHSAERRQLTVMFCDLVGSTPLSGRLDPEDLRDILRAYQQTCAQVVARYEGHIARYFGDGVLVYFGYPQAHEDDAERAVLAGLDMLAALGKLNGSLAKGIRLQIRIGVHTGLVVAGDMDRDAGLESMAVIGETPNIAARLQDRAEPDSLLISEPTCRLLQGSFELMRLGPRQLRGVAQRIVAYQVLGASNATETQAQIPDALIGRQTEIALLADRWQQAHVHQGQVVLLSGEAGIGKSRLVQALKERAATDTSWLAECRCFPYFRNTALQPIAALLARLLDFGADEDPAHKLHKLKLFLRASEIPPTDAVPLLATLLELPFDLAYHPLDLPPDQLRRRTMNVLADVLLGQTGTLLLIVEDLQWADASTMDFLTLLNDRVPTARICALFTYRPDFAPPLADAAHLHRITLNRLARTEAADLIARHTRRRSLSTALREQIIERADGIPLFVEELSKMIIESGANQIGTAIPETLQDSLMARLDRLGAAKDVAQMGAVLGREFSRELLLGVSALDEPALDRALTQLIAAELLTPAGDHYAFTHNLIQEAAYHALLKSTRQRYHQLAARTLQTRFPDSAEAQPEILAHHFTEAGLYAEAVPYWQQAGQRAIARSAPAEAAGHLHQGLRLLSELPDSPQRQRRELELHTALGPALIATRGWAAPEAAQAYQRARQLADELDAPEATFPILWGLFGVYLVQAELPKAHELATELLALADTADDDALRVEAHHVLGSTLYCMGEFRRARQHLDRSLALYRRDEHDAATSAFGMNFGVSSQAWTTHVLWHLGHADQARRLSEEALATARTLEQSFSQALALIYQGILHQLCGEAEESLEVSSEAIALCSEQHFAYYLAWGTFMESWAGAHADDDSRPVGHLQDGIDALRQTGGRLRQTYYLALLAESHLHSGQPERAKAVLDEALGEADRTKERFWEAELHRLRGEVCRFQGADAEAETHYVQALQLARRQESKALQLRAATSLADLWRRQGSIGEARVLLGEIYEEFAEGLDTEDLWQARELLHELE